MLEDIADKTIAETNNKTASETKAGIEKVHKQIEAIKNELPENVRDFYLQDTKKVYGFITRPTFMQSVDVALKKLGIDGSKYQLVIKEIDKARRQVVHSERYDGQFLVELLTHGTTTIEKDEDGKTVSMTFGIKTGSLDKLYELLAKMIRAYLDQYKTKVP